MKDIGLSIAHYAEAQGASHDGVTEFVLSTDWIAEITKYSDRFFVPTPEKLPSKVRQLNTQRVKAAFELHFNACGGCGAKGCETLYYPNSVSGKALAKKVQQGLVPLLNTRDRGVKEGWYKMDRPHVVDYFGDKDGDELPDYFLRKTRMPALILEPLFIEEAVERNFKIELIAEQFAELLEKSADSL